MAASTISFTSDSESFESIVFDSVRFDSASLDFLSLDFVSLDLSSLLAVCLLVSITSDSSTSLVFASIDTFAASESTIGYSVGGAKDINEFCRGHSLLLPIPRIQAEQHGPCHVLRLSVCELLRWLLRPNHE